jgi:H/ACA ribonucleoprotein complex subunit 3
MPIERLDNMLLRYYTDGCGKRVYTLKERAPTGECTLSGHPAKFSPDDPYSRERMLLKQRFNLLLTQHPGPKF